MVRHCIDIDSEHCEPVNYRERPIGEYDKSLFMPPTLKKLMGHIAFGACVSGCVGASHFLYLL